MTTKEINTIQRERRITATIDRDLKRELILYCHDNGVSLSTFVHDAIESKLKREQATA